MPNPDASIEFAIASWDNDRAVLTGVYNSSNLSITQIKLASTSSITCVATAVGPDGQTVIWQGTLPPGNYTWNLPRGTAAMVPDPVTGELGPNWSLSLVGL